MASTYSPLKIELITTGEQSGTWGSTTNVNLGTAIGEAITGSADVTFASANVTLTLTDTNGTQTARNLRLRLTGTTGGARDLIVPNIEKQYIVQNDTANTVTIKNSTGTGVAIPSSVSAIVFNDGVNITSAGTYSTSIVTPLLAATDAAFVNALPVTSGGTGVTTATGTGSVVRAVSPSITSPTLTTPALGTPASGVLTSCTGLPLSTGIVGTLGVTNGGTGVTTSTGSGSNVLNTSPTLVTPLLGTPTSGTLTNCTGLPVSSGVSGLGTGIATFLTTPSSANLAAAVTGETGSGALVFATSPTLVTPVLGTPSSGTLTSCTGLPLTTGVTGTLPVANGGTGVTTSTGTGNVVLSTSPTLVTPILGTPTSGTLTNCTFPTLNQNTTGNAATATLAATATNALACSGNSATATQFSTASGSAPSYGTRAWVNFNGAIASVNNLTGTYVRLAASSTVTVTATAHGQLVGSQVYLDFTTGTGLDGIYTVVSAADANTFTVTTVATTATSGNVSLRRCSIRASGNVSSVAYLSAGDYAINFTTAMPDANFSLSGAVDGWSIAGMNNGLYSVGIVTLATTYARVYAIGTNGGGNNTAFYIADTPTITAQIIR